MIAQHLRKNDKGYTVGAVAIQADALRADAIGADAIGADALGADASERRSN